MPSTYDLIRDVFFPLHLCGAIVVAYLIHEWTEKFRYGDDYHDDDDEGPPGYV